MNDEQMRSVLDEWFHLTDPHPPSARRTATHVMARVPQTRQRGHWLPFRLLRPTVQPPTAADTIEYQPSPIPASNGHTPTVIGRTSSMLSPAKAIVAGALVFAIGGAFLLAQQSEPGGGIMPGAEAEAIAPTWVTGNIELAPSCTGPDSEQDGAVRHDWNSICSPQTWTSSDPRFTGEVSARFNEDVFQTDAGIISVSTAAYDLRNDDGGWTCSANSLLTGSGHSSEMVTGDTLRCVGEGGYEGLSALLVNPDEPSNPFLGLVFSGDFPPLPQPPAAE